MRDEWHFLLRNLTARRQESIWSERIGCIAAKNFSLHTMCPALAVECHLRAHLRLLTDEFDSRHDLRELAKEAEFTSIVPRNLEAAFSIKIRDAQSTLAQQPAVLHRAAVSRLYDYDQSRVSSGRKSLEGLESYDSKSCS